MNPWFYQHILSLSPPSLPQLQLANSCHKVASSTAHEHAYGILPLTILPCNCMWGICQSFHFSVRLPVSLMNACFVTKRKKIVPTQIPHKTTFNLVFWQEKWLGATTSSWNFDQNWPYCNENAGFQSVFPHSASAVRPSKMFNYKKVQLTLTGSPLQAFQ